MPTYEYECRDCGHVFEIVQKMTDSPRKRCPMCRGAVARRVGVGAGIIFKGSGFYQTDYRSEEYRKREKAESTPQGEPAAKGAEPAAKGAEPSAKGAEPSAQPAKKAIGKSESDSSSGSGARAKSGKEKV